MSEFLKPTILSTAPSRNANVGVWELDLYSRPVFDKRGKKIWEVFITDENGTFVFSDILQNNKISSYSLGGVLTKLLDTLKVEKPAKCLYFRGRMENIIYRALTDLRIKPLPSRRCFRIISHLENRFESVYEQHPYYSATANRAPSLYDSYAQPIPDALRGEKWAFVQLSAASLEKEAIPVMKREIFGSFMDFKSLCRAYDPKAPIPGIAVFSSRANPLSAWTNGLELVEVKVDTQAACIVLESGVDQRWRYASYKRSLPTDREGQAWEKAKEIAQGFHFLVIQPSPESSEVSGLWLLRTQNQDSLG